MCTNIDRIRSLIIDNLTNLDRLLFDWERQCVLHGDNRHHFLEIRSHIDRVKYHAEQIKSARKVDKVDREEEETAKMREVVNKVGKNVVNKLEKGMDKIQGEIVSNKREEIVVNNQEEIIVNKEEREIVKCGKTEEIIVNIPADAIEKKIMQEKTTATFRNKEIRKAPSWKYLDKWKEILDEEWAHYRNNDNNNKNNVTNNNINLEDFRGVNIIVPKRIQKFNGTKKQKFNSTECILDEIIETKLELSHKRFVSAGDLLGNFDFIINEKSASLPEPNYLLSLRDLQSFDRLDNLDDLSTDSEERSDEEYDVHKPRIVGVIYKDKL